MHNTNRTHTPHLQKDMRLSRIIPCKPFRVLTRWPRPLRLIPPENLLQLTHQYAMAITRRRRRCLGARCRTNGIVSGWWECVVQMVLNQDLLC